MDPLSNWQEEEYQDVSKPRKVRYKNQWKEFQDATSWINLRKAQDTGLDFWQTRANAITFYDPVPADSIERVVNTRTEEILYERVSLSSRPPPKIILKEAWQVTRDDSHQRGTSTVKSVADEEKKELEIDRRIQGTPQAEVEQEDERTRGIER